MATIAENLQTIIDIKADIRSAIVSKGVNITDDLSWTEYANKISEITGRNLSNFPLYNGVSFALSSWTQAPDCTIAEDITDMQSMFYGCTNLINAPAWLSNINTSTRTRSMFYECSSLTSLVPINTSNVTDASGMFYNCRALTHIPDMDCSKMQNIHAMFYNCRALTSIGHLTGLGEAFTNVSSEYTHRILRLDWSHSLPISYFYQIIEDLGVCPYSNGTGDFYVPTEWTNALTTEEKIEISDNLYNEKNWNITWQ